MRSLAITTMLDLRQSTQKKLANAHSLFDSSEWTLALHAATVNFSPVFARHPFGEATPMTFVLVVGNPPKTRLA